MLLLCIIHAFSYLSQHIMHCGFSVVHIVISMGLARFSSRFNFLKRWIEMHSENPTISHCHCYQNICLLPKYGVYNAIKTKK